MYIIEPPLVREVKVYLCARGSGRATEYASIEDFCIHQSLDFVERWVGRYYGEKIKIVTKRRSGAYWDRETRKIGWQQPEEYYYEEADFIIRTDIGDSLTAEELAPVYWEIRRRRSRDWRRSQGLKSGSCYGRYTAPRTTNEIRQAVQNKDDGEPTIRCRRNKNNLPSSWDDKYAGVQKSWKYQSKRKNQYKNYTVL